MLLATFIFHEEWTVNTTPPDSPLLQSLYFQFCGHYPNRLLFVKTSLPWENDPDTPVITGIPIHCSLLNKLMEVQEMQTMLQDKVINMISEELDERTWEEVPLMHHVSSSPLRNQMMNLNKHYSKILVFQQQTKIQIHHKVY